MYFLSELKVSGEIILKKDLNFEQEIYNANIPFRPGVYLVYSLSDKGKDEKLLYYGKAGVTNYSGNPKLNFHQLPKRLIATTKIPKNHPYFGDKKEITRAILWPWYVENIYTNGFKIYWYITEWPAQNPNIYENKIKEYIKKSDPKWKKSI